MSAAEAINEIAGYIALAAVLPLLVATAVYGFGSPWYDSWLGRTIFAQWASLIAIFVYILTRRFWGEYPGFEWWAVCLYSLLFLAFTAMAAIVIIERRAPARALARKDATMSNTPAKHDAEVPERTSFFATARKAFVAGGAAILTGLAGQVPLVLADGKVDQGEVWASAGIVVGLGIAAFAAVYRVSNAIPAAQLGQVEGQAPGVLGRPSDVEPY